LVVVAGTPVGEDRNHTALAVVGTAVAAPSGESSMAAEEVDATVLHPRSPTLHLGCAAGMDHDLSRVSPWSSLAS